MTTTDPAGADANVTPTAPSSTGGTDCPTTAGGNGCGTGHCGLHGAGGGVSAKELLPEPAVSRRTAIIYGLVIALLHTGVEWLEPFAPGFDEGRQLRAAIRAHQGLGFTSAPVDDLRDLAEEHHPYLAYWPPALMWLFYGLLSLGLSPAGGAVVLQAAQTLITLAGSAAWLRFASRFLPVWAVPVAGLGLAVGYNAQGDVLGMSNMVVWAVVPVWLTWLMRAATDGGRLRWFAAAGLAGGVMALWRYSAVAYAPAGALFALLLMPACLRWRLIAGVLAGAPAVAAFGAAQVIRILNDAPAWGSEYPSIWDASNLLHDEPLVVWFAFGFGLDECIFKLRPSWRAHGTWGFVPVYALMAWVLWQAWRAARGAPAPVAFQVATDVPDGKPAPRDAPAGPSPADPARSDAAPAPESDAPLPRAALRAMLTAIVPAGLLLIAALAWIAFRTKPDLGWEPLAARRFYGEFVPAIAILWWAVAAAAMSPLVAELRRRLAKPATPASESRPAETSPTEPSALSVQPGPRGSRAVVAWAGFALMGLSVAMSLREIVQFARYEVNALRQILGRGVGTEWVSTQRIRHWAAQGPAGMPHRVLGCLCGQLPPLRWDDRVKTCTYMDHDRDVLPDSSCSRPTWTVVVVHAVYDPGSGRMVEEHDTLRGLSHAKFFGLTRRESVVDGGTVWDIWAGVVQPYARGSRPTPRMFPPYDPDVKITDVPVIPGGGRFREPKVITWPSGEVK